jgi:hypothetical protein
MAPATPRQVPDGCTRDHPGNHARAGEPASHTPPHQPTHQQGPSSLLLIVPPACRHPARSSSPAPPRRGAADAPAGPPPARRHKPAATRNSHNNSHTPYPGGRARSTGPDHHALLTTKAPWVRKRARRGLARARIGRSPPRQGCRACLSGGGGPAVPGRSLPGSLPVAVGSRNEGDAAATVPIGITRSAAVQCLVYDKLKT